MARAARPTAVAKELAWAEIVDRTDLPNAIMDATIGGFVQPDQVDLLRAYRDRYFEVLPRVWAERTMEMAQSITMGLYPMFLVDDETIAATDAFLRRRPQLGCRAAGGRGSRRRAARHAGQGQGRRPLPSPRSDGRGGSQALEARRLHSTERRGQAGSSRCMTCG